MNYILNLIFGICLITTSMSAFAQAPGPMLKRLECVDENKKGVLIELGASKEYKITSFKMNQQNEKVERVLGDNFHCTFNAKKVELFSCNNFDRFYEGDSVVGRFEAALGADFGWVSYQIWLGGMAGDVPRNNNENLLMVDTETDGATPLVGVEVPCTSVL